GVGGTEAHVEGLDTALLLHPAIEAHRLVEDLQPVPLAPAYRGAPVDHQHAVGHADSFRCRPATLCRRACPADPRTPAHARARGSDPYVVSTSYSKRSSPSFAQRGSGSRSCWCWGPAVFRFSPQIAHRPRHSSVQVICV